MDLVELNIYLQDNAAHADAIAYLDPFNSFYGADVLRAAAMRDDPEDPSNLIPEQCPLKRAFVLSNKGRKK